MTKPILILSLLAASVILAGCFHDPAEVLTGPQMSRPSAAACGCRPIRSR
ncbi:putative lipoprotein YajG [Bradyrhizobium yuanmingense]